MSLSISKKNICHQFDFMIFLENLIHHNFLLRLSNNWLSDLCQTLWNFHIFGSDSHKDIKTWNFCLLKHKSCTIMDESNIFNTILLFYFNLPDELCKQHCFPRRLQRWRPCWFVWHNGVKHFLKEYSNIIYLCLHQTFQRKFKLFEGKFTWGNKAKHYWVMSTFFLFSKFVDNTQQCFASAL